MKATTPPRTIGSTLLRLGPGMIVAGSIVGSGELIATTKVGAESGFWLLWLIIVGCVIKVFTQVEFGRYTITWSQTTLEALDSVPGPRFRVNWIIWCWVIMTALVITQQGGIVGGVGQAMAISRPITEQGRLYNQLQDELVATRIDLAQAEQRSASTLNRRMLQDRLTSLERRTETLTEPIDADLWATIFALITAILLYAGRYGFIQIVATTFVAIFTVVTIVTLILLQKTGWSISGEDFLTGLRFRLPPIQLPGETKPVSTALAAFGIIGLGALELIMYPYWCLEKGYAKYTGLRDSSSQWIERARGWVRVLHVDAWLSMVVYTFATIAFFLLGAAVLWRNGLNPAGHNMVRTLAEMYIPVFGQTGYAIFLFGAFTILYSTFFVAAAGNARIIADSLGIFGLTSGSEKDRMRWTRILSVVWPIAALVIYLFIKAPVAMVLASGVAQGLMLPALGFAALYFRYRRIDDNLRPGRVWDILLWLSFVGFLIAGVWTVVNTFLR